MSVQRFSSTSRKRLFAVVAGVIVAEVVWLLADRVFGIHVQAPAGNGYPRPADIGPGTVGVAAGVLSLLGWGLLAVLERFTLRARGIWLALSLLALVASLGMPLSGSGVRPSDRAALVLMHVAVAAIVIPVLYRTSRPRAKQPVRSSTQRLMGEAA